MSVPAYREDAPSEQLRDVVVCTWTRDASPSRGDVILPDGCVDIVWDGESIFVAGPDTGPVVLEPLEAGRAHTGLRFRPGTAPAYLGVPASAIRDQRVPLDELWDGATVRRLTDALGSPASARATVLEHAVLDHAGDEVDGLAAVAVHAIARVPSTRVDTLADRLGVSERTLHRRVQTAVGYGPKVLARVVRFRRFLALASRRDESSLADLAHAAGYADQAHLARDCRALADRTPAELAGPRRASDPAVRFVQDGLTPARG